MSTSTHSSATNVDAGDSELPRVEALFLVRFDQKVGYTIAWKRTTTDISLDNAVEYKSLPSGLHAVASDLVYFAHDGYAGLSAFARGDASAEERNANFVSVGVLARRDGEYGRLGRTWLLAGRLEKLAATLAEDVEAVAPLEEFWREQTLDVTAHGEASSDVKAHSRARAIATIAAVPSDDERLPDYHPARCILQYMDVFGPLVFRLQQAALLRKRILFVGSPPVRAMCEFVYILSILSSISAHDSELLLAGTEPLLRLPTLFTVGIHDIPSLEASHNSNDSAQGWAACTTDDIIATKAKLYDIIVELPRPQDTQQPWPRVRTSSGAQIKASQRDVARYKLLHKELFKHRERLQTPYTDEEQEQDQDQEEQNADTAPLVSRDSIAAKRADEAYADTYDNSIVEPMGWSRLAYMGFMWWASAGEKDTYTAAEGDMDRELLGDLSVSSAVETSLIAYFHRQAAVLVQGLTDMTEADEEEGDVLVLERMDMARLGLDAWSEADKAFVSEFADMYLGRAVDFRGGEVDCCGLRVPVM